ncbi:shikimate kinase [Paraburkholderia phenazinium]|jgi:shikimate kinase|uniref:Shikimate kinase n=1 Tax=Paraburkholderia phenazinium TaxID=60549 RepID=A0A1G7YXS7_9BURK|nr:shikimate kinase [Paraburkholderia phenazinium]SDH01234.1 shikimate kinase [Paraburkholderia phenazinium]
MVKSLSAAAGAFSQARRLVLVGMMGAGKTTIGARLGALSALHFVDVDRELERRVGKTVREIFHDEGEPAFRQREALLLDELTARTGIVVATGGGAVLDAASRERLRSRGLVVYLHTEPELLWERVRTDTGRPLLNVQDPRQTLESLYAIRDPLYRDCAGLIVETAGRSATEVADSLWHSMRVTAAT